MANIYDSNLPETPEWRTARLAEAAGAVQLGMSVYEPAPGQGMVFHYHVSARSMLIVLRGVESLRTADGWSEVPEGEVIAFPRGERGAHGYENRGNNVVWVLVASEMNAPNISVYPDTNEVGIFDAAKPSNRRFGALFRVDDAVSDYGGGKAEIIPSARRS